MLGGLGVVDGRRGGLWLIVERRQQLHRILQRLQSVVRVSVVHAHRGVACQLHAELLRHPRIGQRRVEAVAQRMKGQTVELALALALDLLGIDLRTLDDANETVAQAVLTATAPRCQLRADVFAILKFPQKVQVVSL